MIKQKLLQFLLRMTTVVECWNELAENVVKLTSWVSEKESESEVSIVKLETQLQSLKTIYAEQQKLISDLDSLTIMDRKGNFSCQN